MSATDEQVQEILALRDRKVAPKQIARKLGLRPAEVSSIIRTQAEANPEKYSHPRALPPLKECLINANAADYFLGAQKQKNLLKTLGKKLKKDGVGGLAQIFLVRQDGHQYAVTSFLVDYWCLGVKDAFGPRKMSPADYERMVDMAVGNYDQAFKQISLEQIQAIVFGAYDYAKSLGLDPHPDFERAKKQMGPRLEDLPQLEFGKDGKPYYISGPYDNPDKIIAKLTNSVGADNFTYLIQAGDPFGPALDMM
ncbi:MAG: DNA-binding response regulator [Cyanobacteria bacterium P01_G01_bin.38]